MKFVGQGIQKLRARTGQTDTTEHLTMTHLYLVTKIFNIILQHTKDATQKLLNTKSNTYKPCNKEYCYC